jgi:hypothetical protein
MSRIPEIESCNWLLTSPAELCTDLNDILNAFPEYPCDIEHERGCNKKDNGKLPVNEKHIYRYGNEGHRVSQDLKHARRDELLQ